MSNHIASQITGSTGNRRLEGQFVSISGLPAGRVDLRLYHRGLGAEGASLLGETRTDSSGHYVFAYECDRAVVNLEVRAVDPKRREMALSSTKFGASLLEAMNLVLPSRAGADMAEFDLNAVQSEYSRLIDDVAPHLGPLGNLGAAEETDRKSDVTLLHRATGWDARLIALAAQAERLVEPIGISREAAYALLRAGLPGEVEALARFNASDVEAALAKARESGVVDLNERQVAEAVRAFERFSLEQFRSRAAPGALSSFGDLVDVSGLGERARKRFETICRTHRGSQAELWQRIEAARLPVRKLQTQARLATLTRHNAPLVEHLGRTMQEPEDLALLVEMGLHRKEGWTTLIGNLAASSKKGRRKAQKDQAVREMIPPFFQGEQIEARLDAYTSDLARQVRLNFPTKVIARMIMADELQIGPDHQRIKEPVAAFLNEAVRHGFVLGAMPLGPFLRENKAKILPRLSPANETAVVAALERLARLYQVSPGDEALKVLLDLGFSSAYELAEFGEDEFVSRHGDRFPSLEEARLVVRKAQQVTTVASSVFAAASQVANAPMLRALSPPGERIGANGRGATIVKHFPSLDRLFGSLDGCACEECQSVLSPAAYFVDLLQFLDTGGPGRAGETAPTPFDVLVERRPDLPHIALSCENTHTALPYIDVVNEILEYFVAHQALGDEVARDTGGVASTELLAEPQNVLPAAYEAIESATFPIAMPFDLWLETVRQFTMRLETPLAQLLEKARRSDALFPVDEPYGHAAIFLEALGLSPAETRLFTDPNPLDHPEPSKAWYGLYGFASAPAALTVAVDNETGQRVDLNSAKALSRRLGVSYAETLEIAATRFVNPGRAELDWLAAVGLAQADAFFYRKNEGRADLSQTEEEWIEAFSTRLEGIADAVGIPLAALKASLSAIPFERILALTPGEDACNFDQVMVEHPYASTAEAKAVTPIELLRINLFVRLWRKLKWTIEETDRVLCALVPTATPFDDRPEHLAARPLGTALIYLSHVAALMTKLGARSPVALSALWSDLQTTGRQSPYARLFLTPSLTKTDGIFAHPLGRYLQYWDAANEAWKPFHWTSGSQENVTAGLVSVEAHLGGLQSALGLSREDIVRILDDVGTPLAEAALSLETVSLLHRHGLLAKALGLSVKDVIALKTLSGLDSFTPLSAEPLEMLNNDHPFSQTLRFVEMAKEVERASTSIEELDYLLLHRFDEASRHRPDATSLRTLVQSLAEEMRAIRDNYAIPDDPSGISREELDRKLSLALAADIFERLQALRSGTADSPWPSAASTRRTSSTRACLPATPSLPEPPMLPASRGRT